MIEYFNLIFWLTAVIGAVLLLGAIFLRRIGADEVAGAVHGIGAVCLGGGFISLISLYLGGFSFLAVLAVLCAYLATRAQGGVRVGLGILALGLALFSIYQLPGDQSEWLATIAIIMVVLGLASALVGWFRPSKLYADISSRD